MSFLVDVEKWDAKLQITTLPSLPSETSAESYALTPEQSKTEDGGLELEFVLSAKPNSNIINIPFSKENITLFYQPPLTEEFQQEDCEVWTETYVKTRAGQESWRAENVVGSYAVYHVNKKNNAYKTGKICHIFRSKLIDADGETAWAEFNRDANETGILTIILPQAFLDSARYPVTVDPTFGYTSIGGSSTGFGGKAIYALKATMPEAGDITKFTAYLSGGGGTRAVLYQGNPTGSPLATGSEVTTSSAAWYDLPISYSGINQIYWLAVMCQNAETAYYDTGPANIGVWTDLYTYPTPPSGGALDNFGTWQWSIYATYTSGATVQTVADSLSLAEAVLRNKTLILTDSLGLTEALYGNKSFSLSDSASLSELVTVIIGQVMKYVTDSVTVADLAYALKTLTASDTLTFVDAVATPSRVLQVLEAIGAADNAVVNKVLQITETVSLAEIVEVGTGGVKKTKLFLILGDLTVQLTGD